MTLPRVFKIKRGSIDDGPGIRTVIFFAGCPLRCAWCHNPQAFAEGYADGGRAYDMDKLIAIIREDTAYYKVSGGGVTFSGGEPTVHTAYVGALAQKLHARGISCALQTCGYFDWGNFATRLLPYIDCIFYDIKLIDPGLHKEHTGKGNTRILENLRRLTAHKITVIPRTPMIPGITDTDANINGIESFLGKLGLAGAHVKLPYNETL